MRGICGFACPKSLTINDLREAGPRKPLMLNELELFYFISKKRLAFPRQSVIMGGMINNDHKTFRDLVFQDHANQPNGIQARLDLGNGIEISVVSMKTKSNGYGGLYGDASNGTYEVAMYHNNSMLPLAKYDDVLGWQDEVAITRLMGEAQRNGFAWVDLLHELRNDYTQSLLSD